MTEVPWFTEPPPATLAWSEPDVLGHLHFVDPKGRKHSVPITLGPCRHTGTGFGNVWHIEIQGDVATVSPSVHYVGEWHTPNSVRFRLVDELPVP